MLMTTTICIYIAQFKDSPGIVPTYARTECALEFGILISQSDSCCIRKSAHWYLYFALVLVKQTLA